MGNQGFREELAESVHTLTLNDVILLSGWIAEQIEQEKTN